ncbi:MAG: hypothetical protein ACREBJ_03190 [Nitrosotalea sp.]
MTDANNSGNDPQPQQVLSWNGQSNGWLTVPVNNNNPVYTSGNNIIFILTANTQEFTITVGAGGADPEIELDLPNKSWNNRS